MERRPRTWSSSTCAPGELHGLLRHRQRRQRPSRNRRWAEAIQRQLRGAGRRSTGVEGTGGSSWLLVDFGDVVAHVFHHHTRQFYDLEGSGRPPPRIALQPRAEQAVEAAAS